jgi:hypothetical protein
MLGDQRSYGSCRDCCPSFKQAARREMKHRDMERFKILVGSET